MNRWEFWLRLFAVAVCILIYFTTGSDTVVWLFAATWLLIHLRADEIMAEIKKGQD